MSHIQHLPLELVERILDYLDTRALQETLRTARFLHDPSEKRLYHTVCLSADSTKGLGDRQGRFLDTILRTTRLAHHVVKLVMGGCVRGEKPRVNATVARAMKNMHNLKQLGIFGYPYILCTGLDSVPFGPNGLIISTGGKVRPSDVNDYTSLVSILQAHPKLEELALDYPKLPSDLAAVLKAEEDGSIPASKVLCPRLKRFYGYDEGLRTFLPMRTIESGTTMILGSDLLYLIEDVDSDVWMTPALMESYLHLRFLEVWPARGQKTSFLSIIAPYLASLTHIHLIDSTFVGGEADYLLLPLRQLPALKSVTLTNLEDPFVTATEVQDIVGCVCTICPDIEEIFVGGEELPLLYHYTKGNGIQISSVEKKVECRPYTKWLCEP